MPFEPNPERERMYDAIAESFSYGQTFISSDIALILCDYGYNPSYVKSRAIEILKDAKFSEALVIRGVSLAARKYRGITVYLNGNLAEEETDINKSLRRIDRYWEKSWA